LNVSQLGMNAALSVGVGEPVAVTVKLPAMPIVNAVLFALVMIGATFAELMVSVKFCVALGRTPLAAVNVIG